MGWQDSFQPDAPPPNLTPAGGWQSSFQPDPAPDPSITDQVKHQLGLTGRYLAEGAASLPLMAGDAANSVVNNIAGTYHDLTSPDDRAAIDNYSPPLDSATHALSEALTSAGVPNPQNPTERVVGDMSRAAAGAGTGMGIGKGAAALADESTPYAQRLAEMLQSAPKTQLVSSAAGAGAGGAVRENGGSPGAQLAANLLLASAMPASQYVGSMGVRGVYRGGAEGAKNMRNNIDSFAAAGTTPTVGQATEGRMPQFIESMLTKTPGSGGVMVTKGSQQAKDIADSLERRATDLAPKTSATTTGRLIDKGITGENGFIQQFKNTQGQLYDKLDTHIPLDTPIDVSNTKTAIGSANQEIPGAPNVSKFFQNAKIAGIGQAINQDAQSTLAGYGGTGNTLPYEATKKLRTVIGGEMADNSIASDVPNSKWKALYAGLSQDMQQAASNTSPEASQAWNRANNYTRAGMNRVDLLNGIVGKDTPEQVFQSAISGTREGATNLRAVMRSLPDEGRQAVTATVIRRLGIANPSNQNDLGDAFSTNTFLTNWSKLSPEAKQTLFNTHGSEFQNNMDQVAKVASNLREGSKVFANPSGTEQALSAKSTVGGIALAVMTGHTQVAAGIAGGAGIANLYARLVTNPNFVKWLAQSTKVPASALPITVNNLSQWAAKNNDQDSLAAAQLIKQTSQQ